MERKGLLELMTQEASEERRRILNEAQRVSDSIVQEAERRASAKRSAALSALQGELDALARRSHDRSQVETARMQLAMQDEVVREVLERVRLHLCHVSEEPGFGRVLIELLRKAMGKTDGNVRVLVPQTHGALCGKWLRDNAYAGATVEPTAAVSDGVILEGPRGTYRITHTLRSRFAKLELPARRIALEQLFGKDNVK
jgi:vacuolar-type H+-ATPase subunit E/Vma4